MLTLTLDQAALELLAYCVTVLALGGMIVAGLCCWAARDRTAAPGPCANPFCQHHRGIRS